MGEERTGRDLDRLTVAQAAAALNISQDAVRKRITRGTIPHDRDESGRVFVYLSPSETVHKTDQDIQQDAASKTVQDAYIRSLEDQIAFLRRELERKDGILLNLTERIPQLEAPSEARESPQTVEEEPQRAEPRPAAGEAQEGTERLQQQSGWLAPVDKLPWWHYALGISVVFLAMFILDALSNVMFRISGPVLFAVLWTPSGIFGFWVGFRRRNLRLGSQIIPVGTLVAVIAALATRSLGFIPFYWDPVALFLGVGLIYVSGALLGNAWQRRRTRRISGTTPASPVSRTTQGAAQQHRRDLTPAQQAMLGWGGAIISALITLVGTIIAVRSGR